MNIAKKLIARVVEGPDISPEKLAKMSAAQLDAALQKADQVCSALGDKLIDAGRGHERASDTQAKAKEGDALAIQWSKAHDVRFELSNERKNRLTYHGSTKPIRRG